MENQYAELFDATLKRITTFLIARFPGNPDLRRAHQRICLFSGGDTLIKAVGAFLYKIRDQVYDERVEVIHEFDLSQLSAESELVTCIVQACRSDRVSLDEKRRLKEKVENLLDYYLEYLAPRQ